MITMPVSKDSSHADVRVHIAPTKKVYRQALMGQEQLVLLVTVFAHELTFGRAVHVRGCWNK